jgi:hypothetical protein
MSQPSSTSDAGATPSQGQEGVTPSESPQGTGATPNPATAPANGDGRDAQSEGDDREARRDAETLPGEDIKAALKAERERARTLERELKRVQAREKERADAEKNDLERATERAETAEARIATMEREMLARQVANEAGIPSLWHRLVGSDVRTLRADAMKAREEMGLTEGALDGGVRGQGASPTQSMDDLIRGGVRR